MLSSSWNCSYKQLNARNTQFTTGVVKLWGAKRDFGSHSRKNLALASYLLFHNWKVHVGDLANWKFPYDFCWNDCFNSWFMKSSFNPMNREWRITPQVQEYLFLQKKKIEEGKRVTLEPFTIDRNNAKTQNIFHPRYTWRPLYFKDIWFVIQTSAIFLILRNTAPFSQHLFLCRNV